MEETVVTNFYQRRSSAAAATGKLKQTKQRSKKTKPIKVKYISNPMKVETCASKFRELVQELTGQDAADRPPEAAGFSAASAPSSLLPDTLSAAESLVPEIIADDHEPLDGPVLDHVPDYFEPMDENVFVNRMAENFYECFAYSCYN